MKAAVIDVIQETQDVKTLILKPEKEIDFIPGQFMMVYKEGEKLGKAYSIASPPGELLRITFKLYPNGRLSPHLWSLKPSDEIEIAAPYGHFRFQPSDKTILISGGTGIAPMRCLALHCIRNKIPFKMLASFRTENDVIYKDELTNLGAELVITSKQGRINEELLRKLDKDSNFYVCGSPEMVLGIEEMLLDLGVDKGNIRTERW